MTKNWFVDEFYRGKRVLVTGHTGFKGSWLCLWLQRLGSEVCGYALEPPTKPGMFDLANVADKMLSITGDIRNYSLLRKTVQDFKPEIVIHMAAQALIKKSLIDPIGTYSTNVMGTVHLLDALRHSESVRAVVVVTSDKCYENREWDWGYRENDALGGHDPYSNSKGCSELVSLAYVRSFFSPDDYQDHGVAVASARSGNVIGGGDFSEDRLIPDMVRAFMAGTPVRVRSPYATRPWQYVLEPLSGYLMLARRLYEDGPGFAGGWNFGPDENTSLEVGRVVNRFAEFWGEGAQWSVDENDLFHEAGLLKLDCSKARKRLGWKPCLDTIQALDWSAKWYHAFHEKPEEVSYISQTQVREFECLMS